MIFSYNKKERRRKKYVVNSNLMELNNSLSALVMFPFSVFPSLPFSPITSSLAKTVQHTYTYSPTSTNNDQTANLGGS